MSSRFVAHVDDEQDAIIREATCQLGAAAADTLKMFSCDSRLDHKIEIEPFDSEEEATAFATSLSSGFVEVRPS